MVTKLKVALPFVLKTFGKYECEAKNLLEAGVKKNKVDELVAKMLAVREWKSHKWGGVARVWTHGIQFWFYYHDTETNHKQEIAAWSSIAEFAKQNQIQIKCKDVKMDPSHPGFIDDAEMLKGRSGKRAFEYQSYDDYIVAFEQRYLNAKELCNPAALAAKFRQILEAGMEEGDNKDDKGNFIQVRPASNSSTFFHVSCAYVAPVSRTSARHPLSSFTDTTLAPTAFLPSERGAWW